MAELRGLPAAKNIQERITERLEEYKKSDGEEPT